MPDLNSLRYPIGKFVYEQPYTTAQRQDLISQLENLPGQLRRAVANFTEDQLDTPYREHGWTIRQVVHHVADSHMNGYIRTKLALTEQNPTIKPYEEALWADLRDTFVVPVTTSLTLVDALHARWVALFRSLSNADFTGKTFVHPGNGLTNTLDRHLGTYVWHGKHHLAHIVNASKNAEL
ncbi:MAG: putative metal-dependent hydrolase [Cytophagaceae bacterium]|nr:putative metal-dependent hydrolase [Cytophagaceae bacterium]